MCGLVVVANSGGATRWAVQQWTAPERAHNRSCKSSYTLIIRLKSINFIASTICLHCTRISIAVIRRRRLSSLRRRCISPPAGWSPRQKHQAPRKHPFFLHSRFRSALYIMKTYISNHQMCCAVCYRCVTHRRCTRLVDHQIQLRAVDVSDALPARTARHARRAVPPVGQQFHRSASNSTDQKAV